jgi:hypothetical protein
MDGDEIRKARKAGDNQAFCENCHDTVSLEEATEVMVQNEKFTWCKRCAKAEGVYSGEDVKKAFDDAAKNLNKRAHRSLSNLAKADWKRLESNVVERIRLLEAATKGLKLGVLKDEIEAQLIFPNLEILAAFCANVKIHEEVSPELKKATQVPGPPERSEEEE